MRGQALPRAKAAGSGSQDGGQPPTELLSPMPGLPPTPEQLQQARRLAEAGTTELERVKEALEPRKPPAATKRRARDPQKARVRAGLQQMSRGV